MKYKAGEVVRISEDLGFRYEAEYLDGHDW